MVSSLLLWGASAHGAPCDRVAYELAFVGDVMQHGMQLKASMQPDGRYSWDGVFDAVAPVLRGADVTLVNLETPIGGHAPGESPVYSGYPLFNAPPVLIDALVEAGVDVVQTANNHCLDRGEPGLYTTLEHLHAAGLQTAGTYASQAARDDGAARVRLTDGAAIAVLAYTYGTNGEPMPEGKPWTVNWIDEPLMRADIAAARAWADLVIVGVHWGREYRHAPEPEMVRLARSLVDGGADIVWGHHPHVVQPHERHRAPDGRDGLILYSLGNFVSNQRVPQRDGGLIARVRVSRCVSDGPLSVDALAVVPVWVDDRRDDRTLAYRVLPTPPVGAACRGPDVSAADCARMVDFRDHTLALFLGIPHDDAPWVAPRVRPWSLEGWWLDHRFGVWPPRLSAAQAALPEAATARQRQHAPLWEAFSAR